MTSGLPPAYTHPYHKIKLVKRPKSKPGVAEKIEKLKKIELDALKSSFAKPRKRKQFASNFIDPKNRKKSKIDFKTFSKPTTCPGTPHYGFMEIGTVNFIKKEGQRSRVNCIGIRGKSIS